MASLIKDAALRLFAYKRRFNNIQDVITAINNKFPIYQSPMTMPFGVEAFTFDAKYVAAEGDIAISVVMSAGHQYAKNHVAYILSQMEHAEQANLIRGGVVIYLTDNIDEEWENGCIAMNRQETYNGQQVNLNNQYCVDWEEPRVGQRVKRRYVLFFTEGARSLDD